MKNLIAFFALSTLLFFASCSKEALIQPETEDVSADIEMVKEMVADSKTQALMIISSSAKGDGKEVTVISNNSTFTTLDISFTSSYDFTGSTLASTQTIDFTDGSGNTVSLTFGVNSYSGGNGTLDVSLALGGNDLTGLGMKSAQIIVDDIIMD